MVWKIGCRNGKTSPGVAVLAASAAARPANSFAAAGRDQAHAGLDQADVAFQRQHAVRGMHQELAAAAERHALHGGDGGDLRVLEGLRGALELLDRGFQHVPLAGGAGFDHLLQVGAYGEGSRMPDDQAVELALGAGHGLQDAFQHLGAQRVVLGDDRQDGHARIHVGQVPKAHAFVFQTVTPRLSGASPNTRSG